MESNPYTSPSANLFGSTSGTSMESVPQGAITQLQRTKPWTRLLGVILWLVVALMLFGGVGMLVVVGTGLSGAMGTPGAPEGGVMIGLLVVYGLVTLLYIYPAIKIWKYGSCIGRLVNSRSPEDLEAALNQQRALWCFAGVMTLIFIAMYVLAFVFGMATAVTGGSAFSDLQQAIESTNP